MIEIEDIMENGSRVLDTGRVCDGRVSTTRLSKILARFARFLGGSPSLTKAVRAAQAASDNLKAGGFDPGIVDRAMWIVTGPFPFPLSALNFAERIFTPALLGVEAIPGGLRRVNAPKELRWALWLGLSFSDGVALITDHGLGLAAFKGLEVKEGLGGTKMLGLVALPSWRSKAERFLNRSGMSREQAKTFVAGHELGHLIFDASEIPQLCLSLLTECGFGRSGPQKQASIMEAACELFCDATGSLAARPTEPGKAQGEAAKMRTALFNPCFPSYLKNSQLRSTVASRLADRRWSGEGGAPDLAAECLASAMPLWLPISIFEARGLMVEAFETVLGRPWASDGAPLAQASRALNSAAIERAALGSLPRQG